MICPPNSWSDNKWGGYLTNEKTKLEEIVSGSEYHGHVIKIKEELYRAVNCMQNVKFIINKDLLNYLNNDGKLLVQQILALP